MTANHRHHHHHHSVKAVCTLAAAILVVSGISACVSAGAGVDLEEDFSPPENTGEQCPKTSPEAAPERLSVKAPGGRGAALSVSSGLTSPVKKGKKFHPSPSGETDALVLEGNAELDIPAPAVSSSSLPAGRNSYPIPPDPPQLPAVFLQLAVPGPFPVILPLD